MKGFYESVCSQYCGGVSFPYPVFNPYVKVLELKTLGLILSCGYIFAGVLHVRIVFPEDLPDHVMVEWCIGWLT